jgi:hypothetical protein
LPTGYETRVATTEQLLELVASAIERGFNRAPNLGEIEGVIDPDGWHVLSIILPFHERHWAPPNSMPDPPHHRCDVLMKAKGITAPYTFRLDVTDEQFKMLGTVAEARMQQWLRAEAAAPSEPTTEG